MDCGDGQVRAKYHAQKAEKECLKTWWKNNQSKPSVGGFARVFQEDSKACCSML